ncbi:hypothetical protein J2S43_003648 [Catenuloplanes nepalensis]|uniref:Uncharacterized protein n=1 Tax=Catenuloplanes nepalensis TaxID=587533 RepID=A0ABT9MV51_9ACTN|nr:hypothetical protein [Catenuloplanes nepalensis]MDP9795136.1 hypothetical protein [Catenuloplanes nepalensis]
METSSIVRAVKRAGIVAFGAAMVTAGLAAPAMADRDGSFNAGSDFAVSQHTNYGGYIYDRALNQEGNYGPLYFVNSNLHVGDNASSSRNGRSVRIYGYVDSWCGGATVTHLPYGQVSGSVSWGYTALGWANDRFSSHSSATSC